MIFRVFGKGELAHLYSLISRETTVVGPVQAGVGGQGGPLYAFETVSAFDEMRLDYTMTVLPAKRYCLPPREHLSTFTLDETDWGKHVDYHMDRPLVMFGLHACDINALNRLDKVLMGAVYPMPFYAAKRKNLFIIGIDCTPAPSCFCRSMGADTALHGFDLFLTDLGTNYFAEILSDTAYNFLREIKTAEPRDQDHARYRRVVAKKNAAFVTAVDSTDLTKILDMEFQSEVWEYWGERCLACGTCASVCPTCYCYGVEETVSIDLREAYKTRTLYSCNLIDFARVAGGHNFRPGRPTRLKYRYYHKHRGFVEAFEEPLCVGCGRCGAACLAGITVPDVITSVREGKVPA